MAMDWPRRKILVRAIDNNPDAVLQWIEDNCTRLECLDFADTISPVTDELRSARLATAAELVKAYAPQELVEDVGTKLSAESDRLKPAVEVVAKAK